MRLVQHVIWLIVVGRWLTLRHLADAMAITAPPLSPADHMLIPVALAPLGVEIAPVDSPGRTDRICV